MNVRTVQIGNAKGKGISGGRFHDLTFHGMRRRPNQDIKVPVRQLLEAIKACDGDEFHPIFFRIPKYSRRNGTTLYVIN